MNNFTTTKNNLNIKDDNLINSPTQLLKIDDVDSASKVDHSLYQQIIKKSSSRHTSILPYTIIITNIEKNPTEFLKLIFKSSLAKIEKINFVKGDNISSLKWEGNKVLGSAGKFELYILNLSPSKTRFYFKQNLFGNTIIWSVYALVIGYFRHWSLYDFLIFIFFVWGLMPYVLMKYINFYRTTQFLKRLKIKYPSAENQEKYIGDTV